MWLVGLRVEFFIPFNFNCGYRISAALEREHGSENINKEHKH